jgi:TrmH family RNA methyltransferase
VIGKSRIKLVRSLEQRKYRCRYRLFVAEGDKIVREMLASHLKVASLIATEEWLMQLPAPLLAKSCETLTADDRELSQISTLKTSRHAVALVEIPEYEINDRELSSGLSLYLDKVQDPGNMGAILRVADWFGIRYVMCGEGCADPYSPKTVQATMGAIIRVKTCPADTVTLQRLKSAGLPVYGAFLQGDSVYSSTLAAHAVIVLGNESQGISDEVAQWIDRRLYIPPYPAGTPSSESLNVAAATAVICSEFRRPLQAPL